MEKNNIKIYLCDDNIPFIEEIGVWIQKILQNRREYQIETFTSGRDLLKQWKLSFSDVVFLDIDMPGMNGFEIASLIQKSKEDVFIIFVTSHEDMVYQSYEYHPFWFVRKSHMEDLKIVLPKLLRKIDAEEEKKKFLYYLQTDTMKIELDINTIMYIESIKNDIVIKDRVKDDIKIRCKLSNAEKQLYPLHIIRIQNGILVNCRFIGKITCREVILTNGKRFNLSRGKIDFVKEEYQHFVRSKRL
ncbi:LytR/AlgR family response regulator transcription factor [Ructibacterium gallinarum]|uniref:Stage 0 sporulation protein A homolog n=1 Tax=Ructibacterium gallinarum TaxID=2779355 RepID=A0A9D5M209_9FIRM|nr:LytTR family DNA-binding domain-containing protein [Ructibacterium gallinarum]MBE5039239.1 response regulator transcription factor [Ructibacterium gallinarum]